MELVRVVVAAMVAAVLVAWARGMPEGSAQSDPWAVPVAEFDFPDPDLVIDGAGTWFAFATGGGWFSSDPSTNIRLATSEDRGATWTLAGDALPEVGSWAQNYLTWAPAVIDIDGSWLMFYSAPDRVTGRQCIGRATSENLSGPFVDAHPAPIVCQPELGGSIDPEVFHDAEGALRLMWKNDGNAVAAASFIWTQPLTDDGMGLTGNPTRLLGVSLGWEEPIIEHPAVVVDDALWVLYAAGPGYWDPRYSTGVARCELPVGPCSRAPTPLITADGSNGLIGPGGAHAASEPNGSRWILHHGWSPDRTERWLYRRPLAIEADIVTTGDASAAVGPPAAPRFTDVPPTGYFAVAVEWADRLGVTNGTTPTTFSPERLITRSEVAVFVHRSAGSPPPRRSAPFLDVPVDSFFGDAVAWMSEAGITTGTTPTTFSPERLVTRGEVATFLHRLAGSPPRVGSSLFLDVPADSFFGDAVAWMSEVGITTGTTPTTFSPERPTSRAEVVTFLHRSFFR